MQVNYLSHWQLTRELLQQRQEARARGVAVRPLRIVNLTSVVHQGGHIWFDDLQFEKKYWPFACYGQVSASRSCVMYVDSFVSVTSRN